MRRMMIFALLVFCLSAVSANAIFGGETINYDIDRCEWLTVNITPSEWNEWSVFPNCTEQTSGNFYCDCEDNWTIFLKPAPNSVGIFDLTIKNYYEKAVSESVYTHYPPSSEAGVIYKNVTINVTKIVERNVTQTVEVPVNVTVPETVEVEVLPSWLWYVFLFVVIMSILVGIVIQRNWDKFLSLRDKFIKKSSSM